MCKHHASLKALEFKPDDIIRMVSHNGGSKNLEAVCKHHAALKALEFKPDDIIRMVSHDGGSKNLEVLAKISREHNDANVLAPGARLTATALAMNIARTWLETEFTGEERHVRRIRQMETT